MNEDRRILFHFPVYENYYSYFQELVFIFILTSRSISPKMIS